MPELGECSTLLVTLYSSMFFQILVSPTMNCAQLLRKVIDLVPKCSSKCLASKSLVCRSLYSFHPFYLSTSHLKGAE